MAGSSTHPSSSLGDGSPFFSPSSIGASLKRAISYITEAPKATRLFAIAMLVIYLMTHIVASKGSRRSPLGDILGLIPAYTFSDLYIWNVFTAGFYHAYFIEMVFSVGTLLVAGKYLESFWGTREFVKFVVLVNVASALGCVIWTVGSFVLRLSELPIILPDIPYGGFGGVISAFAVAGKQLVPEYETPIFGFIPARMRHMPMALLLSNFAWHLLGFPASSYSFVVTGTFTAWIYLRYFQLRPGLPTSADGSTTSMVRGDRSDATSFIGFLPETIQPTLSKIFNCGRGPSPLPPVTRADFVKNTPPAAKKSAPAVPVDLDAERRRLSALQQVDARIAKMKAKSTTSMPSTPIAAN